MLKTINDRIELILDKDHLIGHSYFMRIKTVEDMQKVFKNKIIPLLEEYFYGKPQMIGLILGSDFVKQKDNIPLFNKFDTELSDFNEKKMYQVIIPDNWNAYKKVYENNKSI